MSQGGRDHSSHRLVYTGKSDKQTVGILFGLELMVGVLALIAERTQHPAATLVVFLVALVGFRSFGIYLSRFAHPY